MVENQWAKKKIIEREKKSTFCGLIHTLLWSNPYTYLRFQDKAQELEKQTTTL